MIIKTLIKLSNHPKFCENAANWFSQKWHIPTEVYKESIQECIKQKNVIPQWYIVLNDKEDIIAGAGIIENDFHNRKDLTPNLCALFVEEKYRKQGIAKYIWNYVRKDLGTMGFEKLYLITDHTKFYEKYDWEFVTLVTCDYGNSIRLYVTSTL